MLLDGPYPSLPTLEPRTLFSFYPYQTESRSYLHSTLQPLSASGSASTFYSHSDPKSSQAGPSSLRPFAPLSLRNEGARRELDRAERRALLGRLPAGVGLGREDDQVSLDEEVLDHEQRDIDMFGHRFLLPFGRRLTQMEMDAAPSPSPSDPDHERRQEDQTMRSPPLGGGGANGEGEIDEEGDELAEGAVDLDASIEDLDASGVQEETSMDEE